MREYVKKEAMKFLPWLSIMVLMTRMNFVIGKRVRGRENNRENKYKHVSNIGGEDTCISGHCIESTYNKLELPPSHPSHVRLNLEVVRIIKTKSRNIVYQFFKYVILFLILLFIFL